MELERVSQLEIDRWEGVETGRAERIDGIERGRGLTRTIYHKRRSVEPVRGTILRQLRQKNTMEEGREDCDDMEEGREVVGLDEEGEAVEGFEEGREAVEDFNEEERVIELEVEENDDDDDCEDDDQVFIPDTPPNV